MAEEAGEVAAAGVAAVAPIIIPEGMDQDLAFTLSEVVGMTNANMRTRLLNQGIKEAQDLGMIDVETLTGCFTAQNTPSAMIMVRLKALKAWVDDEMDIHEYDDDFDVLRFTEEVMKKTQRRNAHTRRGAGQSGSKHHQDASSSTKAERFDGKHANWKEAKNSFVAQLTQIKNPQGISLYYVIREENREEEFRHQYGILGARIYDAPLKGTQYE